MSFPSRPKPNGEDFFICDVLDPEMPEIYKKCWCQTIRVHNQSFHCSCHCHKDSNTRNFKGKEIA